MSWLRLQDFIARTNLPESVIVQLLQGTMFPLKVNDQGYLLLEVNESAVKKLLAELAEPSLENNTPEQDEKLMRIAEKVLREEMGDIFQQALQRLSEE